MAKLFGDADAVAVYSADIHVDHNTHDLVVDERHGHEDLQRVVTEAGAPGGEKADQRVEHIDKVA